MSDTADTGATIDSAPAPENLAPSTPAPAPTTAPSAAPAAEADPFDGDMPDDQVFSRGYVEKLRNQGRTYREQANENAEKLGTYEQVYGQYEDADRNTWFDMANEWARDPRAGAEMMQRISEAVLNDGLTPEQATEQVIAEDQVVAQVADTGASLTAEQVEQIVQDRMAAADDERRTDAAVEAIYTEMRDAGFDPKTRDGHSILWTANNETGGDIAKAVEIVKADRQKIIDDYVSGKATNPGARPAPDAGVLATNVPVLDTLDEAFAASRKFLDGMQKQAG